VDSDKSRARRVLTTTAGCGSWLGVGCGLPEVFGAAAGKSALVAGGPYESTEDIGSSSCARVVSPVGVMRSASYGWRRCSQRLSKLFA